MPVAHNYLLTGSKTVSEMDKKSNHDAVMKVIEKQKLIADHLKEVRDNYFWSNGLALSHSPALEAVPGGAWELPQYPNVEKWADRLFSKTIPLLPHMSGHTGFLGAIASAVIAKTNNSQEVMDRATRLADLEWQLQHLTYWSAPTHEPNKRRKTFGELNRQRELLRESAIEALCLYQCGAHDFLNDFERYNSDSICDFFCAEQYKAAFNKVMAWVVGYCNAFDASESRAKNRSGQTEGNKKLKEWLKNSPLVNPTARQLWESISDEYGSTKLSADWYMHRGDKNDEELLFIYNDKDIVQSEKGFDGFANFLSNMKKI